MKLLIADDEAISRRLLQSYLERWGHEVVAAQNGAEAWKVFEAGGFPILRGRSEGDRPLYQRRADDGLHRGGNQHCQPACHVARRGPLHGEC